MPSARLSFPTPQSTEESNPFLTQFNKGPAQLQAMIEAQNASRYTEPNSREALQKAILANKYYGPQAESDMALQKAQAGLAGAQSGLAGAQTDKLKMLLSILNGSDFNGSGYGGDQNTAPTEATPSVSNATREMPTPSGTTQNMSGALPSMQGMINQPNNIGNRNQPVSRRAPVTPNLKQMWAMHELTGSAIDPRQLKEEERYTQLQADDAAASEGAQQMMDAVNQFTSAREKAFFKGSKPFVGGSESPQTSALGRLMAAFGADFSPEQEMTNAKQNLVSARNKLEAMGRPTEYLLNQVKSTKLDESFDEEAVQEVSNKMKAAIYRTKEKQQFDALGAEYGIPERELGPMWQKYTQAFGVTNSDGSINQMNLGKSMELIPYGQDGYKAFSDQVDIAAKKQKEESPLTSKQLKDTAKKYGLTEEEVLDAYKSENMGAK